MTAMSTASPVLCSETLPLVVRMLWPHFSALILIVKPFARRYSSTASTRRSICPVSMSSRP